MPRFSADPLVSAPHRLFAAAACLALACLLTGAAKAPEQTAALESLVLMHVDGNITIEPDGRVGDVVFDTKFDDVLRSALDAKMRGWHFTPVRVAGQARRVETKFQVMLAAEEQAGGVTVRIDDTSFGDSGQAAVARAVVPDGTAAPITLKRISLRHYPINLKPAGQIGRVHLVMRIAPDGRVADVMATQSLVFDIDGRETDAAARRAMRTFEASAIADARTWTFNVPGLASARSASDMSVAIDVEYESRYDTAVAGQWLPVKRGPQRVVDWLPPDEPGGTGVGMGAAGQVAGIGSPYRLETPVAGNIVK